MAIPNLQHEVEALAAQHPEAWRNAHTGGPQTEDFIRLLAAHLHRFDRRFGLNGKRGNPNDISDDAINFRGEGAQVDPTNGNSPVAVIDVIVGAGGPNPRAGWQTFPDRHAGAWVQPDAVPTPQPQPQPQPPPPSTSCKFDVTSVLAKLELQNSAITAMFNEVAAMRRDQQVLHQQLANIHDQASAAAHDANVGALAALEVKDQLARGFDVRGSSRYFGTITGTITPKGA